MYPRKARAMGRLEELIARLAAKKAAQLAAANASEEVNSREGGGGAEGEACMSGEGVGARGARQCAPAVSASASVYGSQRYWGERYERAAGADSGSDNDGGAREKALANEEWYVRFDAWREPLEELMQASKCASEVGSGGGTGDGPLLGERALVLGCGMSLLCEELADARMCDNMLAVDFSPQAVEFMQARQQEREAVAGGPDAGARITYTEMDVRSLDAEDGSFDAVIDKATLDSLANNEDAEADIARMLNESHRVLRPGGVYVCLSYGGPTTRTHMLCRKGLDWRLDGVREVHKKKATFYLYVLRKRGSRRCL